MPHDERAAIARMRAGHAAAARRQLALLAEEGPRGEQAVEEANAALAALAAMGMWPGPRDPASERQVEAIRARWARIQRRARADATQGGG